MFHIIEDAHDLREAVVDIFQYHGFESISFDSSEQYLGYLTSPDYMPPIAVFTDVNMPGMSGYEMIRAISNLDQTLKFVVMTSETGIRQDHTDAACIYVAKPFCPTALILMAERLIRCHDSYGPTASHACVNSGAWKEFPTAIGGACRYRCMDDMLDCNTE
ncbi:MAG: hypothetical protein AUJ57_06195 [Zetaproteobacteria bacterium CG1_02_53_45]|nr:MAG: hypothetical protein AUJ57_06195 [Zetaproteobacteria bacterium CG1_02_53_45]